MSRKLTVIIVTIFAAVLVIAAVAAVWLYPESGNTPAPLGAPPAEKKGGKILFYQNPMNPEITSPTPKKDQMGMDYIPVYEMEPTTEKK